MFWIKFRKLQNVFSLNRKIDKDGNEDITTVSYNIDSARLMVSSL